MKKFLTRLILPCSIAATAAPGLTIIAKNNAETAPQKPALQKPNSGATDQKKGSLTKVNKKFPVKKTAKRKISPTKTSSKKKAKIDLIPEGRELVTVNFKKARIEDIVTTIAAWTGKRIVYSSNLSGTVSIISGGKVTKLEAYQLFLEALKTAGYTIIETGKVTTIVPLNKLKGANSQVFNSNKWSPRTGELVTQLIKLEHLEVSGTTHGNQLLTIIKGMLPQTGASVHAFPKTNSFIVTASGNDINRILAVIKHLDSGTQQRKIKIVPLKYSDPKSIESKVLMIEPSARPSTSYFASSRSANTFKLMADERTNSVILFGTKEKLDKFESIIKTFDKKPTDPANGATIHVRPLDYAKAEDLAKTLNNLLKSKSSSNTRNKYLSKFPSLKNIKSTNSGNAASAEVLDKNVTISSDKSTNSLIITGSRVAYNVLNTIIKKLDQRKKQVYIEAEIIEVTKQDGFKSDFSVLAGDGDNNFMGIAGFNGAGAASMAKAATFAGDPSKKAEAFKDLAETFSSGFKVGLLGEAVDILGFKVRPGVLISLLKSDGNSRTLSSPQILTLNNEEGTQVTGNKIFYQERRFNEATNSETTTFKPEEVDLTFKVTPNVSYSDYVTLDIDLEANTLLGIADNGAPTTAKRHAKQKVTVKNGQTVVISGLLTHEERNKESGIPLLKDIPGLGFFFRSTDKQKEQKNLMVFVTPHVVYGPADLASIYKDKVQQRDDFIKHIYGDDVIQDDFYRLIPSLSDGVYKPTEIDKIEEKRQKQQHEENLKMMGYTKDGSDDKSFKSSYDKTIEKDLPLPSLPTTIEVPEARPASAPAVPLAPALPAASEPQSSNSKKNLAQ